jgi:hypothetical protein
MHRRTKGQTSLPVNGSPVKLGDDVEGECYLLQATARSTKKMRCTGMHIAFCMGQEQLLSEDPNSFGNILPRPLVGRLSERST